VPQARPVKRQHSKIALDGIWILIRKHFIAFLFTLLPAYYFCSPSISWKSFKVALKPFKALPKQLEVGN
jgi:hypothetical protein